MKQSETHTQGNWSARWDHSHSDQALISTDAEKGQTIAVVYDKRDALIIAAAPDMLEALEKIKADCIKALEKYANGEDFPFKTLAGYVSEVAETAINKAKENNPYDDLLQRL